MKSETIGLDLGTANNGVISYNYDVVGNRLSRSSTVAAIPNQTSNVDANDRLTSDTYDANGSTTASAGRTYTYDFESRIVSLNIGNPALNATFLYDGDGNRVSKTVGTGPSAVTTKFLVDTNNPTGFAQVVEEVIGGSVQRIYIHGLSLISQAQVIDSNWTTSFYGMDGHGSARFLVDATGAVTATYTFEAFGNPISSTGSTPNNYLYAGEQFDYELGVYYLRSRYLAAALGRFLTADHFEGDLEDPRELHPYMYAFDEPVDRIDPSGFVPILVPPYLSLAIGIAVHGVLYRDFVRGIPATTPPSRLWNRSISKILKYKGVELSAKASVLGLLVRPDLIDMVDNLIYEIKPVTRENEGRYQQLGYLFLLNKYDPKSLWFYGNPAAYTPSQLRFPLTVSGYGILVEVFPPDSYGVITYDWDYQLPKFHPPSPSLVIALVVAMITADLIYRIRLKSAQPGYAQ